MCEYSYTYQSIDEEGRKGGGEEKEGRGVKEGVGGKEERK
jgi:hypothetical protein